MSDSTRVLVTGATGFIGSRLVDALVRDGVPTRALARRTPDANLHRPCYEIARGDVTDLASVQVAAAGCDVIFHCAWGGATLDEARRINVQGTGNVISAAAAAGVRRVVHVSSVAVHGPNLPAVLTEDRPLAADGDAYVVSKTEGERLAFSLGASLGVETVALRPTLVYGPGSPFWLVGYFTRVKRERVALIDGGTGLANLVYVDDVVSAMRAAATRPGVAGEAFLISGDRAITWREYLGHFSAMCGKPLPPTVSRARARVELEWTRAYSLLTDRSRRLQAMDLTLMTQRCAVSIDKARRMLGYQPAVSVEDGMRRCEAWLRQRGHLGATFPCPAVGSGGVLTETY